MYKRQLPTSVGPQELIINQAMNEFPHWHAPLLSGWDVNERDTVASLFHGIHVGRPTGSSSPLLLRQMPLLILIRTCVYWLSSTGDGGTHDFMTGFEMILFKDQKMHDLGLPTSLTPGKGALEFSPASFLFL